MEQAIAPTADSLSAVARTDLSPLPGFAKFDTANPRHLYIDNIRWVMIMLVLSMHAAVTYSGHGSWYYNEHAKLDTAQDMTFLTYQIFLQSFFMGFLFFIAGYFVPGAYDKKGAGRFLRDRAYRLGLPSLLFIFLIQPVTCYYAAGVWDTTNGFWVAYAHYLTHGRFLSGSGPLWFCVALLFFCIVYTAWRRLIRPRLISRPKPFPRAAVIWTVIGGTTLATFLVRVPWPMGTNLYNMQFCYFSEYIVFFIAGTLAYRHSGLSGLPSTVSRHWGITGLAGGLVIWFTLMFITLSSGVINGSFFDGGWHWQSLGMCTIDALAGIGISLGLLGLFRDRFNRQGRRAAFFSANAFAVYVFHTPILIWITRLMTNLHWLPLAKFLLATVLCIVVTFSLCALLFRRLPVLKAIL
jgi:fucose 4-O-acetylase-like acetyltransferase